MSATREITKRGPDGTFVRRLPLSKVPFQPPTCAMTLIFPSRTPTICIGVWG